MLKYFVPICCGTPNRITKLIEENILHIDQLKLIILDLTKDDKTLTLLDISSIMKDLSNLFLKYLYIQCQHSDTKIILL